MKNLFIDYILFTLINIFQLLNIVLIFDRFLISHKRKKQKYKICWILYTFIITFLLVFFRFNKMINALKMLYFLYYLRFVPLIWGKYKISFKSIMITIFYEEIVDFSASNILYILSAIIHLEKNFELDDMLVLLVAIIIFGVLNLLLFLRRKNIVAIRFVDLKNLQYIVITMVLYITATVEIHFWLYEHNTYLRVISFLLMILIGVLICSIISFNENKNKTDSNLFLLNESIKKMTEHYIQLGEKETELRKFRHDIKNHMLVLISLINERKNEEAIKYIEGMSVLIEKTKPRFDSGNYIADAIINSKYILAESNNINLNLSGFIVSEEIENIDMVILLSNLLDNAIDGCKEIEGNKEINIYSVISKGVWTLTVENPIDKKVEINNAGRVDTTKEEKKLHGYGLINIEGVAKKYGGMMKIKIEDGKFINKVVINRLNIE